MKMAVLRVMVLVRRVLPWVVIFSLIIYLILCGFKGFLYVLLYLYESIVFLSCSKVLGGCEFQN